MGGRHKCYRSRAVGRGLIHLLEVMETSPELLDYVVFFEAEPDWIHPEGWYFGARFTTRRGADKIVASVAPDDMEFSVEWWQDDFLRLRFSSVAASGWTIESIGPKELLRVSFSKI